jgi:hypothetical protein
MSWSTRRTAAVSWMSAANRGSVAASIGVLFAFVLPAAASADVTIGSLGGGAGQYENPRSVAIDRSNGNVYVADQGNSRLLVFDSDGTFIRAFGWGVADGTSEELQVCTTSCFPGIAGAGAGQFGGFFGTPDAIAVDEDPTSPSFHDVFVYDSRNARISRFDPTGDFILAFGWGVLNGASALQTCTTTCQKGISGSGAGQLAPDSKLDVGAGGIVHVLGDVNRLQRFSASGALIGQQALAPPGLGPTVNGFALDSAGGFYTGSAATTGAVRKYDAAGSLISTFHSSFNIMELAVDDGDDLYVSDAQNGYSNQKRAIFHYDPAGSLQRVIYGEVPRRYIDLAPFSNANGDVLAIDVEKAVVHVAFPPPGPVAVPETTRSKDIFSSRATLESGINPEGEETTYRFEYVDHDSFEAEGFTGPTTKVTPDRVLAGDFDLHLVSETPTDLAPDTTYHFRVVATNADGTDIGSEATFTTLKPFEIEDTWTSEVGTTDARVHAEVDPLGISASAYFQYVDHATYEASGFTTATNVPDVGGGKAPIDLGSGEGAVSIDANFGGLAPNTTYHYRVFVENAFFSEAGPERVFHTFPIPAGLRTDCPNQAFRTGASARLSECRAYEMVSPVDKNGGDAKAAYRGGIAVASAGGERVSFSTLRAFAEAPSAPLFSQYLSWRRPEGWSTEAISPPRSNPAFFSPGGAGQYKHFSDDLCRAWLLQDSPVALAPGAPTDLPNLYRRDNCEGGSYELVTTVPAPGFDFKAEQPETSYVPAPQGWSSDGSHSVFRAPARLTGRACRELAPFRNGTQPQVYLTTPTGRVRLISALPDGKGACSEASVGSEAGLPDDSRLSNLDGGVSSDASRVFWTAASRFPAEGSSLYVRVNAAKGQSKVESGECTEAAKACTLPISVGTNAFFWGADPDGERAIYTAGDKLLEFDVEDEESQSIAEGVLGVLGGSEDLSRVYFASTEVLTGVQENSEGEAAAAGKVNVYLYEAGAGGGEYTYVAALAEPGDTRNDPQAWGPSPIAKAPTKRSARVTPDGEHLAFTSSRSLTGYDNRDLATGEAAAEIFLYDAGPGVGELRCISCNPGGARPVARNLGGTQSIDLTWVAGRLPGWNSSLNPSRLLSNEGNRLFFESYEALVLADTNGRGDVYEWRRATDSAECQSAGAQLHVESADGCLSLISSGQNPQDSELVDASGEGRDVFFTTRASLLPHDPGLIDIYDARIGGGYPAPAAPPPGCEGEACQGPVPPPLAPTPGSVSYRGPGDLVQAKAKRGKQAKRRRAAKKRAARKRAARKRQARRRAMDARSNGGRRAGR